MASAAERSPGEPKAVEVSWYSWLRNLFRNAKKREVPMRDLDATDDYPTPTLLTLIPGALRLRFGVVSIVGNYREQNEDNYYVPGRSLGRASESSSVSSTLIGRTTRICVENWSMR